MSTPFSHEAIWAKAKLFVNRSFDAIENDDESLAMLWAACSLELLAKAALCRISPLLVADPTDDGKSLLLAAGLPGDSTRYKSIPAKALFSRCARAFQKFDQKAANLIAQQRNEELHSGALPYSTASDRPAWWERYWSLTEVLVVSQHETLEDFVGTPGRVAAAQAHLDRNSRNVQLRVEAMFDAARQRLDRGETIPTQYVSSDFHALAVCPVCGSQGEIYGWDVSHSEFLSDTASLGLGPLELLDVWTEGFVCNECGLAVEGERYLEAAGIPTSFEDSREHEVEFDDYGND